MEELEELEPLDDGEISAVSPAPPRTSVPPPIPKQALDRTSVGLRPSPLITTRSSAPPPLRSSLPPAPPPAGVSPSTAPSSGIYRVAEKSEADRWKDVVRELELKVRLRDDLIAELKRTIEDQRKHIATTDARVASAEARATSAELRASSAPAAAPDDLKRIKGIGPAFERKLHALGVSRFGTIAAWGDADIERIAEALAILPQRIVRDRWIEKARELSS